MYFNIYYFIVIISTNILLTKMAKKGQQQYRLSSMQCDRGKSKNKTELKIYEMAGIYKN